MNYSYLFVDNLNGHPYEDGFEELKTSIKNLWRKTSEVHTPATPLGPTLPFCLPLSISISIIHNIKISLFNHIII